MMAEQIDLTKADYPTLQEIAGNLGINRGQSKDKLIAAIAAARTKTDDGPVGEGDGGAGEDASTDVEGLQERLKDAEARAKTAEGRVEELKAGGAKVINPTSPAEVERELRRYLKKDGGFKKDLPDASKVVCRGLLKKANAMLKKSDKPRLVEDGWNIMIQVPGFEQSLLNNPADKAKEARDKIMEAAALIG